MEYITYRNQSLAFIKENAEINKKYEEILKKYIKEKYDVDLQSEENIFKHYDFTFEKTKIEYKGLYYKLNNKTFTASKCDKIKTTEIKNVMIGCDKIKYYKEIKQDETRFLIIYGFYDVNDNEVKKITYRYIDLTDILNDIIEKYNSMIWQNKKHYLIPIKDLMKLNKDIFNHL